ncbi:hypothetical protein X777_12543, partial [Ooceraea biroi]
RDVLPGRLRLLAVFLPTVDYSKGNATFDGNKEKQQSGKGDREREKERNDTRWRDARVADTSERSNESDNPAMGRRAGGLC